MSYHTVNAPYNCEVLQGDLIECPDSMLGCSEARVIFQQDDVLSHRARFTKTFLVLRGIGLLPWPSQSPDLNIIANVRSLLNRRPEMNPPKTTQELIKRFFEGWQSISEQFISNLYQSIPRRLEAVLRQTCLSYKMSNFLIDRKNAFRFLMD